MLRTILVKEAGEGVMAYHIFGFVLSSPFLVLLLHNILSLRYLLFWQFMVKFSWISKIHSGSSISFCISYKLQPLLSTPINFRKKNCWQVGFFFFLSLNLDLVMLRCSIWAKEFPEHWKNFLRSMVLASKSCGWFMFWFLRWQFYELSGFNSGLR